MSFIIPDTNSTSSDSFLSVVLDLPGDLLFMCALNLSWSILIPGSIPSITPPIIVPCDSPHTVNLTNLPIDDIAIQPFYFTKK